MKVCLISLGCSKNLVDSEAILGYFCQHNYYNVLSVAEADLIIINTCGFIKEAKKESIDSIFGAYKNKRPEAKIIVTGCLAERYKQEIAKLLPEVDLFVPVSSYSHFPKIIEKSLGIKSSTSPFNYLNRLLSSPNSAYIKISDGCDNHCTYCAIPLIRGPFISRKKEDILLEAEKLINNGVKEITLISQDTTRYGKDLSNNYFLPNLLKDLASLDGLKVLRLLYLYPEEVSDELIKTIKEHSIIAPYFDIPIQHCNDRILALMNRRGNKNLLQSLFKKIRQEIPHAILRTTLIVGFPSETDQEFSELKEFVEEISFDRLGVFVFSPEENTPAFNMKPVVPISTAKKRQQEIMLLQERIADQQSKKFIGKEFTVLVEGKNESYYLARGYMNAPDNIDGTIMIKADRQLSLGEYVKVKIISAYIHDLYGEDISSLESSSLISSNS